MFNVTVTDLLVFDANAVGEVDGDGLQNLKFINVTIEAPDRDKIFQINFTPPVRLTSTSRRWNSTNEGLDRLKIE